MRILILCDQGNNRSVVLASRLKYFGGKPYHDVLTAGFETNTVPTISMLGQMWAQKIIVTDKPQLSQIHDILPRKYHDLVELWDIGPDTYPRPHNKSLLAIVSKLIEDHPELREREA